jgi:hypothetical protein
VPALQPYLIEPIWEQFRALLPKPRSSCKFGVRLRLLEDRRRALLAHHTSPAGRPLVCTYHV